MPPSIGYRVALAVASAVALACASKEAPPSTIDSVASAATDSWCGKLPRTTNAAFERVPVPGDWHFVYRVEPGIFAIVEPKQFQEAISYLIVGSTRALLFDSGIGLVPLKPVVEALTALPVTVLNSHSHFDHVGANYEFTDILALDTPFTRENEQGKPHGDIANEVAPDAFCGAPPANADTAGFRSKPWRVTQRIAADDRIVLGGRTLEVLAAPGHTPDAIALLDRANGLLWTGDSFYESSLWLFSPGTDLAAYERSMTTLAALAPSLKRLLPAHNTISANPDRLGVVASATRVLRAGGGVRTADGNQERVTIGDVVFMIQRGSAPSASGAPRD